MNTPGKTTKTTPSWRTTSAVLFVSILIGLLVVYRPLVAAAAVVAPLIIWASLKSVRFAFAFWFIGLCSIPNWFLVHLGASWPPASLLGLLILPSLILHRPRYGAQRGDYVVIAFMACCTTACLFGGTPKDLLAPVFIQGGLAYLIGRHLVPATRNMWATNMIAIVLTFVGVWSIAEYLLSWHPFIGLDPSSPEAFWSAVQTRAGHVRSEAAFGHAIALGGSLAAGIPFMLMSTWEHRVKVISIAILAAGILATLSRGPLTAAVLGAALVIVFAPGVRLNLATRAGFASISALVAVPVTYVITSTLAEAGTQATASAEFRGTLYSHILEDARVNSVGRFVEFPAPGVQVYRSVYHSIDSTFVQTALTFGWVPLLVVLPALVVIIARVIVRRANIAEITLVAQLPVIATVALITQYHYIVWLLAGMAVSMSASARLVRTRSSTQIHPEGPPGRDKVIKSLLPPIYA